MDLAEPSVQKRGSAVLLMTLVAAQSLLTLAYLAFAIYFVWLSRREQGLAVVIAFCIGLAFSSFLPALGLWRRQRWGYWLGIVVAILMIGVLTYGIFPDDDWELIWWMFPYFVVLILYLLPWVRGALRPTTAQ